MKVLVYQQFHPGHHYTYPHYLLAALTQLADEVIVAITADGSASQEFVTYLKAFESRVRFDTSLPDGLRRVMRGERVRMHVDVRRSVKQHRPDYILIPSGDPHTTVAGFYQILGLGAVPGRRPAEIGIHFGRGVTRAAFRERLKDQANEWKLRLAGWHRVHLVNLLFYERIQRRGDALAETSALLPHPVAVNVRKGKVESRLDLKLPSDGRWIGVFGDIDHRKAVIELISAFRDTDKSSADRLLVAGKLSPPNRTRLHNMFGALIASNRVLLLDRYLTPTEYQTAMTACDVIAVPYHEFDALSSVLLEAVSAGRPVLVGDRGWCRAIVRRFELGWRCDISSPQSFASAVATALDECAGYLQGDAVKRLLAFHSPDNFAESWLVGLRQFMGLQPSRTYKSWAWVSESLPTDRRNLI